MNASSPRSSYSLRHLISKLSAISYSLHACAGRLDPVTTCRATSSLNSRVNVLPRIRPLPLRRHSNATYGEVDFAYCPVSGVQSRGTHPPTNPITYLILRME